MLGLFLVGLLVPSDSEDLLGSGSGDTKSSPFVIAARNAHLWGYDHFMNAVILVSVISIGVSGVYGGSRTLTALAEQGYAPKIFAYIDRSGRPLFSVGIILAMGALGYMNLAATGETIFNWFLNVSGLAALFTWGSICFAHIRFRKAWAHNGHTLDEIPFKAICGVWGSWLSIFLIVIVLVAQVRHQSKIILEIHTDSFSSTSPSLPLAPRPELPTNSSTATSPSSSSVSSGSADTCGRRRDGSASTRSMSTRAGESSTGTTSTLSVLRRLPGPLGAGGGTSSSRAPSQSQKIDCCCGVRKGIPLG